MYRSSTAKMDAVQGIKSIIAQFIEDHSDLTRSVELKNMTAGAIDQRQMLITNIEALSAALRECDERLANLSSQAKRVQEEEINTLESIIGKVKSGKPLSNRAIVQTVPAVKSKVSIQQSTQTFTPSQQSQHSQQSLQPVRSIPKPVPDQSWTFVGRKPRAADVIKTERVPAPRVLPSTPGILERINITPSITLNAVPVKSFSDVKCDGNLYYVTSSCHFAVSINGMLLHGNIGIIYTDTDEPEKIKNCKYVDGCSRCDKCRYYHDPTIFSGSTDRRNYIASSFMYSSPNAIYKNRSRSRRFGSLTYLDTDILGLTDDDKDCMYDRAMHDLLCALVLKSINDAGKK